MPADIFFDSNTLLYLVSSDTRRADRADALLKKGGFISVQVLNEISHVMLRKFKASWQDVDDLLALVRANCKVMPLTEATYQQGRHLAERYKVQVYDAMILAAALQAGAKTLFSEDMHDGLLVEGRLKVRNPFH
ncbi:MAG: PIN domain-containing protein [Acidovorax sp.]|uniref:PIN domain-containing protein n=1 Tax=Acidovorax sp. TaxID=1872122 RepID=UPI0039E41918